MGLQVVRKCMDGDMLFVILFICFSVVYLALAGCYFTSLPSKKWFQWLPVGLGCLGGVALAVEFINSLQKFFE